jgi:translation initiation factor IF-2
MANVKKKRLFKIASEINIGKDAIVAYLNQKGYEVENKPTAMLTEEMVGVVYDKFKREMRAIEVQREKIEKVKSTRKPSDDGHVQEIERERSESKQETQAVPEKPKQEKIEKPVEAEVKSAPKPDAANSIGVGDVIDLSAISNDPINDRKRKPAKKADKPAPKKEEPKMEAPKPAPKKEEPKVETPKPAPKKEEPKVEAPKPAPKKEEPKVEAPKPAPKKEEPKVEAPKPAPKKEEPKVEAPKPAPKKEEPKVEAPKPAPKKEEPKGEDPKAETKASPMSEEDDRNLKGLTVLGKIDISKPKKRDDSPKPERRKRSRRNKPGEGQRNDNRQGGERRDNRGGRPDNRGDNRQGGRPDNRGDNRQGGRPDNRGDNRQGGRPDNRGDNRQGGRPDNRGDNRQGGRPYGNRDNNNYQERRPKFEDRSSYSYEPQDKKENESPYKSKKPRTSNQPINFGGNVPQFGGPQGGQGGDDKKRRKKRKTKPDKVSKVDVEKAVRMTMMEMDPSSSATNRQKNKQKRKVEKEEKIQKEMEIQMQQETILKLTEYVTTSDLANLMNVNLNEVIMKCMELGLMVTINQRLDKDTITLIADDYGFEVEFVDEKQMQFVEEEEDNEENLKPRSPIVTIMGHVDHGKTSLLDYIRHANVVAGEAGGITQHIGAYTVDMGDDKSITFLDTPGHEAFTAMRARGAQVTDLVVLIVAADDSVMPQTIEAISHSLAADVPIVVAINKVDKPDSNPDRIKQQLTDHDVLVEDWGGKFQCAEISAKKGTNVDALLEKILIEAELLELKANPDRMARGVVIESNMSKGFGSVATVIVQKGTLKVGDPFVSGTRHGRVRALLDDKGDKVQEAGPSTPVVVIGYDGLAEAGDSFMTIESETEARKIANERAQLKREQELRQVRHVTLDEISAQIQMGGIEELNIVIKADVGGSAEALADSLLKLSTPEVRVNILHKGVGAITETDVMLAAASAGIVVGFNINPNASARQIAQREHVDIRRYDIIYDCINEVQMALEGMLAPDIKEIVTSVVEIRQTFKISKVGTIAGCHVLSGTIKRNSKIRVLRDGFKIFEGGIQSLKREKDDAAKVDKGFDCGIQVDGFNDIKVDDIIEAFEFEEIKRTLK